MAKILLIEAKSIFFEKHYISSFFKSVNHSKVYEEMIGMTLCGKGSVFRGGFLSHQMFYPLPFRTVSDPDSKKYY